MQFVKVLAKDGEVLKNLMSMYLHDMSEFADFIKLSPRGIYEYQNLNYYWEKEGLSAYFINIESEIAGFILANLQPYVPDDCDVSIQEFFILKKYRGKGYGKKAALQFFENSPGKYYVAQLINNTPAIKFWRSVYKSIELAYVEKEETFSGFRLLTQRFQV